MATVRACDKCGRVMEGEVISREPIEVSGKYAKLVINLDEKAELCDACAKKEQYQAAKEAFEGLKGHKVRKAKEKVGEE